MTENTLTGRLATIARRTGTPWERDGTARYLTLAREALHTGDRIGAAERFGMARGYAVRANVDIQTSTYTWSVRKIDRGG